MAMSIVAESHLGGLINRLQRLPYALTVSDTTQDDDPLIFVNEAFTKMTGYGSEVIGENCRFLQKGLENEAARAEIRESLRTGKRTQVVLHNRRKSGEEFFNLLLLQMIEGSDTAPSLAIGSQFDLGVEGLDSSEDGRTGFKYLNREKNRLVDEVHAVRLERRRLMADATVRLIQSWYVLRELSESG